MESSFEYVKGCERKRERSSQSQTAHQSIRHQAVQILSTFQCHGPWSRASSTQFDTA